MSPKKLTQLLITAGKQFAEDRAMSLAASVSFYTLLSFAPLMVLVVWVSSSLGTAEQDALLKQIGLLTGSGAREAARMVLDNADATPSVGSLAGIGGILVSLFAATTVFAQLQAALNDIWGIRATPGRALWNWLKRRVLSIGVIAAIGFVLIVSLVVSALIGVVLERSGLTWTVLNTLITTLIFVALFALMFRHLPDARLPHRYAWQGGTVTAVLFMVGRFLIGLYLARDGVGSAYGAAAFLMVLMLWVYYASAIFFFGAEFVEALLKEKGERLRLAPHAKSVDGEAEHLVTTTTDQKEAQ